MLSIFDDVSAKNLKYLKLDYVKIPSGEIDNFPMLAEVSKLNSNIIISTGMSRLKEIKRTFFFFEKENKKKKNFRFTL